MTGPQPVRPATATRREDPRVARSRASVLDATVDLLAERGIGGITVEAVAERSGVAKTTIYRQWPALADIVLDAVRVTLRAPADPDTGSVRDDLLALVLGLAAALTGSPAAPLMPALMDAAERDPRFAELHHAEARERHAVVVRAIARGVERGELRPGTDPDDVLDLLAGPVFHRRYVTGRPVDARFAERVVDAVLRTHAAPRA